MSRALVAVVVAVVAVACGQAGAEPGQVRLDEFTLDAGGGWTPGVAEIMVRNEGELQHTVVVTTEDGEAIAASDLIAPGTDATLELDLEPGTYEFSCRIVAVGDDGSLVDHFQEGMLAEVVVEP